jgi:hypothetical protein
LTSPNPIKNLSRPRIKHGSIIVDFFQNFFFSKRGYFDSLLKKIRASPKSQPWLALNGGMNREERSSFIKDYYILIGLERKPYD